MTFSKTPSSVVFPFAHVSPVNTQLTLYETLPVTSCLVSFTSSFWLFSFGVCVFWCVKYTDRKPCCLQQTGLTKAFRILWKMAPRRVHIVYVGDTSHPDKSGNQPGSCIRKTWFFLLMAVKKPQGWSRLWRLMRGAFLFPRTVWKPEALYSRLRSKRTQCYWLP